MKAIKTILCPTDFSECSAAALGFAIELAQRLHAQIHLVHVFQFPYAMGLEDGLGMAAGSAQLFEQLRTRVDEDLRVQAEACRGAGVTVRVEQLDGSPHAKIVEASGSADLIVMGTHGRSGLPRLILGSVAERVMRMAKCAVVTVPAPAH
jgi:nucleotide-binding universal stress UspA family protein